MTRPAEIAWQVKSYGERFKAGFRPPTHGKITTLPMSCGMVRLGHGLFKVMHFLNGGNSDRVHYYGYMGNVGSTPSLLIHRG